MKRNEYYVTNLICYSQRKQAKRRQILKKRIRSACVIVDVIIFIAILGMIGGLERNMLTIKEFVGYGLVAVLALFASFAIYNELEG